MLEIAVISFAVGAMGMWAFQTQRYAGKNKMANHEIFTLNSQTNALESEIKLWKNLLTETKTELSVSQKNETTLNSRISELNAHYANLQEKLALQNQSMDQIQKKFTLEFENLATKILDEKTHKFTKQNQDNLEIILKPFNENLNNFKKRVEETYSAESNERASLKGEIKQLFQLNQTMAKEAKNLTTALKGSSKTQGNWGELILERILEKSGLQKGNEFTTQESFQTDDGRRQQPDVILHLPEKKHIIIDSKVSLNAYETYFSSEDDLEKETALKHHVASVRTHIKQLSEKNYPRLYGINSPDFVLMFMPIEPAFGLAVQHDSHLFFNALDKNVMMVSPSTLLATLQIISNIWKQDRQNKNALEIARQGGALYDKFVSFVDDLDKLGKQLSTATGTYELTMKKLSTGTGNLIGRTEKIKALGAKTSKSMDDKLNNVICDID
jgi:DNA recombination protein RmuC